MFRSSLKLCGYGLLFAGRFIMLPVYFLTGLMPRRKNLWVFGSWGGHRFADNAAAYFLYCNQHAIGIDLVWISREREIVDRLRNAGYTAHWHWSPAGVWACLRAGSHYFDCFAKDTNFWVSCGAFRVCLWSGVPLKVFERDIDVPSSRYYRLFHGSLPERIVLSMMMPWHVTRPDRIVALSEETRDITARAFDVPKEHVLITGYPRNDRYTSEAPLPALFNSALPEALSKALAAGRKVVLYLPTFRDSGRPFSRLDWQHLDSLMAKQHATFFYKFHPLDQSAESVELDNVYRIDRELDVYDLLNSVDILISDYSSIPIDFMLLGRPIVFYTPDLQEFLADCRSLNFHPEELATQPLCTSYIELADQIEALLNGSLREDELRYGEILRRLHNYTEEQSSQRIFRALQKLPALALNDQHSQEGSIPTAIVFGCQKPGWGIIRALGAAGIPVIAVYYDHRDPAYVSRYVSQAIRCPHPEHARERFQEFVTHLIRLYPDSVLMPSNDYSLVALAEMDLPPTGQVSIAAPKTDIVTCCIEKDQTYALAHSIGVRAPRTATVTSLEAALEQAADIGYPCVLKPAVGHRFFSVLRVKMFKVTNREELQAAWSRSAAIEGELLLQEYIPGGDDHGVNYNALWHDGRHQTEITAAKLRLSPREIGFPAVVVNRQIPQIIEPARKLLAAMNFHGFANVEFKRDARNDEYVLMEVNPRLNQSLLLSVASGINFAAMAYRQSRGLPPDDYAHIDPYAVRRYYIDTDRDIREAFKEIVAGDLSLQDFLAPYFSRQVSATFCWADPLPFFKRLAGAIWPG